ncbi:hypothetical protein L596_022864 [Steinernema carpocapsae]|uniref:Uncharacterized protein n=1 Tax=Steinernema carpocapsae TaxID=34508 RepID=A0A4U5MBT9_STECR|nr:hypothetical protein L596_022864 [Steinernema carpocapsae]
MKEIQLKEFSKNPTHTNADWRIFWDYRAENPRLQRLFVAIVKQRKCKGMKMERFSDSFLATFFVIPYKGDGGPSMGTVVQESWAKWVRRIKRLSLGTPSWRLWPRDTSWTTGPTCRISAGDWVVLYAL